MNKLSKVIVKKSLASSYNFLKLLLKRENKENAPKLHPFGGCNTLLSQYNIIGTALTDCEKLTNRFHNNSQIYKKFHETVFFIPVEVLESYREDLLDIDITESKLFINQKSITDKFSSYFNLTSLSFLLLFIISLSFGIYNLFQSGSVFTSLIISSVVLLPYIFFIDLVPNNKIIRRVRMSKIIMQEINSRKGSKNTKVNNGKFELFISEIGTTGEACNCYFH